MRSFRYIAYIVIFAIVSFTSACKPEYIEEENGFVAPDASAVSFTVEPVSGNDYQVKVTNTSSIVGTVEFRDEAGNSVKSGGILTFNLKGKYKITMNFFTKGGSVSTTKEYSQAKDNLALLLSPKVLMILGTVGEVAGKTWVLDTDLQGHLGVGPGVLNLDQLKDKLASNAAVSPSVEFKNIDEIVGYFGWWNAKPNEKAGQEMYDDELNFSFVNGQFICKYTNNGKSYCRMEALPIRGGAYTNPSLDNNDRRVDYTAATNGVVGGWEPSESGKSNYITFKTKPTEPIFPMYDIASDDNKYKVAYIDKDHMVLIGEDGGTKLSRLFILKRKGYVKPDPTFDISAVEKAEKNTYTFGITNINKPPKSTIEKISYKFGDGTKSDTSTTEENKTFDHKYQKTGVFTVTISITTGLGAIITKTSKVNVYALEDQIVTYNDFDGNNVLESKFDGNGSAVIVANPDASKYPNRSANVCKYSKTNDQWANSYFPLPTGKRFTLSVQHIFKIPVYGTKGDVVLLKLENMDKGGNAWQTGVELTYTIKESNKWEEAAYDFAGAASSGAGDITTNDVTKDEKFNHNYYNVIRIMYKPGDNSAAFSFYFDNLTGPYIDGMK